MWSCLCNPLPPKTNVLTCLLPLVKLEVTFPPPGDTRGSLSPGALSQPSLVVAAMATDHHRVEQNGCYRIELNEPLNVDDVVQRMMYL